jgi:arylsulfatase A-like enzyme
MSRRPNIVLMVMDATRFDFLSANGYPRPTTPNLDRLAEDGVIFENSFATGPWTPPSHASMFTGTYPSTHGVDVNENLYLSDKSRTLAEILSENGYRTFGILPDVHLSSVRGFHKGFQEFVETWRIPYFHLEYEWIVCLMHNLISGRDKRTFYSNRVIQRWLKKNFSPTKPFFVFVNYKTVHNRYQPPRTFRKIFEQRQPNTDLRKATYFSKKGGYSYMGRRLDLTDDEFVLVRSWYAAALAYLDVRIGEMIDFLKELGAYENTLLIITADHGESFGEHHLAYHMFGLYDFLIRVPMLMTCPMLLPRGRRITELVSHVDLLPTILEILDLKGEGRNVQGTSLFPFDGRTYHEEIFAEFGRPQSMVKRLGSEFPGHDFSMLDKGLQCIRTKSHKLISGSDGSEELYDLVADPYETHNVVDETPDTARNLRARLNEWRGPANRPFVSQHVQEDEKVIKALRALGYF